MTLHEPKYISYTTAQNGVRSQDVRRNSRTLIHVDVNVLNENSSHNNIIAPALKFIYILKCPTLLDCRK